MSDPYLTDIADLWETLKPDVAAIAAVIGPGADGPLAELLRHLERLACGAAVTAPFRKNDRVRLAEPPELTPTSGWWGARHFLIYWAVGTVRAVRLDSTGWRVGVVFDDDSWIDQDLQKRSTPPENRGVYFFAPRALARIEEPSP